MMVLRLDKRRGLAATAVVGSGDSVELRMRGEKYWATVTSVQKNGNFKGIVFASVGGYDLPVRRKVRFGKCHVWGKV